VLGDTEQKGAKGQAWFAEQCIQVVCTLCVRCMVYFLLLQHRQQERVHILYKGDLRLRGQVTCSGPQWVNGRAGNGTQALRSEQTGGAAVEL
jgi:hypothetical protein